MKTKLQFYTCCCAAALVCLAVSCDKSDDDPRDPAHPRCGHLLPNTHLFDICVDNPFPTTLHPATDTGANTISCWINDTIAFRNWRPWLMGRPDAEGRRYDEDSTQFQIFGTYENFQEIDRRRITLYVPYSHPDTLRWRSSVLHIDGFASISGSYEVAFDYPIKIAYRRLDGDIVAGTFEFAVRHRRDSSQILFLTDGRFDTRWYWF